MFRSPTCTQQDKIAASALALIANINIEEYAKQMFRAGSNLKNKTSEEIFYQDYKKFIAEGDIEFGVGQISSMDGDELMEIKDRLSLYIQDEIARSGSGVSMIFFMLTNILEETTDLIYFGEESADLVKAAFHTEPEGDIFILKGVVSRKKQLIPAFLEAAQLLRAEM